AARVEGVYEPELVLIDGMRAKGALCYTYGPGSAGKTGVEVDDAMRMACGMDYHDGVSLEEGYSVFVAGEGKSDIDKQIDGFMVKHPGATIKYPIKIIRGRVPVDNPVAIAVLTAQLQQE